MTDPAADPAAHPDDHARHRARLGRRMDLLFIVGSACFAVASVPGIAAAVPEDVVVATYFIGSLFFTTAAAHQYVVTTGGPIAVWRPADPAWVAAVVQFVGTLWFNVNTFAARNPGLDPQQENLRVWTPDFIGSICFLVASGFAIAALDDRRWAADRPWWVAALNMTGSVFFMAAALAAYVLPDTGDLLDASVANSGTLLGALCFLVGARLDLGEWAPAESTAPAA